MGETYEQALMQGFLGGVAGHGVTGLRHRVARDIGETAVAPAHRVVAWSRLFGERVEPSQLVVTSGLGLRPLGATAPGALSRFELMTWVDDVALAPEANGMDVLTALSILGRLMQQAAQPGTSPWCLGHTFAFGDGPGLGGWRRFLLARAMRPVETEVGAIDIVRVLPITDDEAAELRAREDMLGGWGFVTQCENRDPAGVLARWRTPPQRPTPTVRRASRLVYSGAPDTLRVFFDGEPPAADAMRDAHLLLDREGFLVSLELTDDVGPRLLIEVGPPSAAVQSKQARVLQCKGGPYLITMGEKRVRGHEPHPHTPWSEG